MAAEFLIEHEVRDRDSGFTWYRVRRVVMLVVTTLGAGFVTSSAINGAVARSWQDCRVGGPGEGFTLLLMFIPNAAIVSLWWAASSWIGYSLGARASTAVRWMVISVLGSAGSLGFFWMMMVWLHDPGGNVSSEYCRPENIPPWWPSWIPL
ncbi:hypothetical protein [Nocardia sp. SSK8]|uniref:hypothetical protein n=1 Tax=Nocardia sp. SSK8 TaxID=3120154 RepID=UPI003008FE7C